MRTKVHGSSIFSGTSAVWKIDVDHGAPESSVSGESGGDRGGQTVEQEESTQKDQRSEGKPGYSEKSVRYKDKNSFSDQKSEKEPKCEKKWVFSETGEKEKKKSREKRQPRRYRIMKNKLQKRLDGGEMQKAMIRETLFLQL